MFSDPDVDFWSQRILQSLPNAVVSNSGLRPTCLLCHGRAKLKVSHSVHISGDNELGGRTNSRDHVDIQKPSLSEIGETRVYNMRTGVLLDLV